jgi:hypothetical protein
MSVFVIIKTREVILASLLLRVVRTYYTKDYRPRLEEVFYRKLILKLDHK